MPWLSATKISKTWSFSSFFYISFFSDTILDFLREKNKILNYLRSKKGQNKDVVGFCIYTEWLGKQLLHNIKWVKTQKSQCQSPKEKICNCNNIVIKTGSAPIKQCNSACGFWGLWHASKFGRFLLVKWWKRLQVFLIFNLNLKKFLHLSFFLVLDCHQYKDPVVVTHCFSALLLKPILLCVCVKF